MQSIQTYLIQSIKELASSLDDQALNQQTLQNIIKSCQDVLDVQAATDELVQVQQEYIEFAEQPVPETITAEIVAAHQAERKVLRDRLLRAYDAYTDLAIPPSMRSESVWTYDTLVNNLRA